LEIICKEKSSIISIVTIECAQALVRHIVNRATRLGYFSPFCAIFYLGEFVWKISEVAQLFG
jgi:hypothetical protein